MFFLKPKAKGKGYSFQYRKRVEFLFKTKEEADTMSKSQNLRAEHLSGALLSTGNLRTVLRGNTQGSPFSTWSTNGHRIILGGREPESAFLKLPQLWCCTASRIFPRDHGLRRGDSTATLQMRATERAAFRAPSRILSTSERAAATRRQGAHPLEGSQS